MAMLETPNARAFLTSIAGARNTSNGQNDNMFGGLFEVEEVTSADEVDLENPEDDALNKLISDLDN